MINRVWVRENMLTGNSSSMDVTHSMNSYWLEKCLMACTGFAWVSRGVYLVMWLFTENSDKYFKKRFIFNDIYSNLIYYGCHMISTNLYGRLHVQKTLYILNWWTSGIMDVIDRKTTTLFSVSNNWNVQWPRKSINIVKYWLFHCRFSRYRYTDLVPKCTFPCRWCDNILCTFRIHLSAGHMNIL